MGKSGDLCEDSSLIDYYLKKQQFLTEAGALKSLPVSFITKPDPDEIKFKLANLRQLVFEVTDACNLKCYYCSLGNLYNNHDKRNSVMLSFKKAKNVIDYMLQLWNSSYNLSYNNIVDISFFGGEPLLNLKLIKQIVSYLESLSINESGIAGFTYRMTTNATLLDMAMDYLVEHDFNLLISLDGDEYGDSYRVTKKGKSTFKKVCKNLDRLKEKYPDYFEKRIYFNAVLHDRNSYESIYLFLKERFGKIPLVSELNTAGIVEDKYDEIMRMYKSTYQEQTELFKKYHDDLKHEEKEDLMLRTLIHAFTGNTFNDINDLLGNQCNIKHMPSGTCMAFKKKVFVTVNGKILPCEKIGQQHPLGFVSDECMYIDFEKVSSIYEDMYKPLLKICESCYNQTSCAQCVFRIYDMKVNNHKICPSFMNKKNMIGYFSNIIDYLEKEPFKYEWQISKDTINA